jgi:trans-aconitate methyltransferase
VTDFTNIASFYGEASYVQKSASEVLFDLLQITERDDVLDLGCGTGELTSKIRERTNGRVVGVDASRGMIEKAKQRHGDLDIQFSTMTAEDLTYDGQFDVIFCNSAFQWLNPPGPSVAGCYRTLRDNGRMAIQAPATKAYCSAFVTAVDRVADDPRTKDIFSHLTPPWVFLDSPQQYVEVFRKAGFVVRYAAIAQTADFYRPDEVLTAFNSGAAAGYLNQNCYDVPMTDVYIRDFTEIIKRSFTEQADIQGKIKLVFNRIYLLAQKVRQ